MGAELRLVESVICWAQSHFVAIGGCRFFGWEFLLARLPEQKFLTHPKINRGKRIRFRFEWLGLRSAGWVVERLPYGAIWPLANLIGWIAYYLDARGRTTALANLQAAFGDKYSDRVRQRIARKSYQGFARTMLCMFWSSNLTLENYSRYLRVEGTDNHPIHTDPARAGVYLLGHFSNFEWLCWVSSHAIMAGLVITQDLKNGLLNPTFDALRGGSGHTIIPRARAIVRMLKFLKSGGKVGAAADLSLDPRLGAVPVKCFGLWTPMSPLAAVLATRAKAGLVPSLIFPNPDGTYRVVYRPPLEIADDASHQEIAQACWDVFERLIEDQPELWLWSYKHWRFRPTNDTSGRYPAYANSATRFDRLVEEGEGSDRN